MSHCFETSMHPVLFFSVIAVEPVGKELSPCLKAGERLWSNPPQFLTTIAEGIMTQQAGQLTFPILCQLIEKETIVVPDDVMIQGMKIVAERMKLVKFGLSESST